MDTFNYYFALVFDGVAYGCIYGLFALTFVALFRANKIFNFAQTEVATLGVVLMLLLLKHMSFWSAMILTILASFAFGVLLHVTIMRFLTERRRGSHLSETIVTIGLFVIFNNISSYLIGDETQPFPSPFGSDVLSLFGVPVSKQSLGIIVASLLMTGCIFLVFRFTKLGLKFEAIAENADAARLRGIRVSNLLAVAWGITIMAGVFAALLIAPIQYVSPAMLISFFSYSLIAVVIGGLESPLGAIVGGIIVGVVDNLAANVSFIGSELRFLVIFALLLLVLLVRPRGLWGRAEARRV